MIRATLGGKEYTFVRFNIDSDRLCQNFSQYRGIVQTSFASGFSIEGWPRPKIWLVRTFRHKAASTSGTILGIMDERFCPPGKNCGVNGRFADWFEGECYVMESGILVSSDHYAMLDKIFHYIKDVRPCRKQFGLKGVRMGIPGAFWLHCEKEAFFRHFKDGWYIPGNFWITPVFKFITAGLWEKWHVGNEAELEYIEQNHVGGDKIFRGSFFDNPRYFYGKDFYSTYQPDMEAFLSGNIEGTPAIPTIPPPVVPGPPGIAWPPGDGGTAPDSATWIWLVLAGLVLLGVVLMGD